MYLLFTGYCNFPVVITFGKNTEQVSFAECYHQCSNREYV